jgi:signal transduction histidine kinase
MSKKHTLLIVDDEPDVVKSVKDLLRLDYKVLGAPGAVEGMDIMNHEAIDVVLSDQRMPGMSGVEFLAKLRQDHPDAIRLLLTGYADIGAVVEAINRGNVYRYITKPWDSGELETIIRDACGYFDLLTERRHLLEELQAKNSELSQSNKLKTAFIRVAGHELRTPLTILLGLSQLVNDQPGLSEPVKELIGGMDDAAGRLDRSVTQILKMLSTERFDKFLNRQPTELSALLKRTTDDVAPFVHLRNQNFSALIPENLGRMNVDAEKLRDSVNQLLLNAIKFTPDSGKISLSAQRTGEEMTIAVTDTGCGIRPEDKARVFEPFFTGFDVSKHSSGHYEYQRRGLGLGLSVVKAFVEMHGGKVDVTSRPGEGSTFNIVLRESEESR